MTANRKVGACFSKKKNVSLRGAGVSIKVIVWK